MSDTNPLCISSLVVQVRPPDLAGVRKALRRVSGAEVVGEDEQGKLVVVLDVPDNRAAAERITKIQNLAGVLSASLIYQYDDHQASQVEDSV